MRRAFHVLYRSDNVLPRCITMLEQDLGHIPEVAELIGFIRNSKRGITLDLDADRHAA